MKLYMERKKMDFWQEQKRKRNCVGVVFNKECPRYQSISHCHEFLEWTKYLKHLGLGLCRDSV